MKRILWGLYLPIVLGIFGSNQTLQAQQPKIEVKDIEFAIIPKGGELTWDGSQWVTEKGTKVEGFISISLAIEDKDIVSSSKIIGSKETSGTTFYLCENGESFWVIGTPTGGIPEQKRSLVDPGVAAPVVADFKEIQNLDLNRAVEMAKSEDPRLQNKAGWVIWKIKFQEAVESLTNNLKKSNTAERVEIAGRLGFIHHPMVIPALIEASRDPDDLVRKAAENAILRLGSSAPKK